MFIFQKKIESLIKEMHRARGGFTFLELLVSIAIVAIISSVVVANYWSFSRNIELKDLTYEVALTLRQAQVFGVNVKMFEGVFDLGYGVHFDNSYSGTKYILFADKDRDLKYGIGDGIEEEFNLYGGYIIQDVCALTIAGVEKCLSTSLTHVDIVFDRPELEANFSTNISEAYKSVTVTIEASDGRTQEVDVGITGFIKVSLQRGESIYNYV